MGRGALLRDRKAARCSYVPCRGMLGREQVVEGEFALNVVPVIVVLEPGERDHDEPVAAAQGNRGLERGLAGEKPFVFRFVDFAGRFGVFDFADVDRLVRAVQQQVDLGMFAAPSVCGDLKPGDSERTLDFTKMLKAETFEGETMPVGDSRRIERVEPEACVVPWTVSDERIVEERVVEAEPPCVFFI